MLRELIHIDQIKTFAEEAFNSWLSYAMAQPVSFDIAILVCFLLQYFGLQQIFRIVNEFSFNSKEQQSEKLFSQHPEEMIITI